MRKANFDSVRGKFKFNNNQFPIQDLFMMEVAKDANGGLTSKLKEVVAKDWQDPLHTQCPMKW
jgi:branched-chain amino acid transport system substrate-binding protein